MDEKSLYAHILNLTASWQVKALSLDEKVGSVTVTVGIAENVLLSCPTCGKTCPVHDHRHRKWRHLDTCQFTTVVEADVPRIMCPDHGCQTLPVPWAGPGSRYTLLFESFVISWLKISTTDAVRKQLRLSWNAVDNIMQRAVRRGLARRKAPQSARHLCVDEVAFKRDISTSPSSLIHRARRWNSGMIAVLKVWRVTSETWVTARLNPSKPCRWI
ncbi:transposase [Klebsiella pneumoniae]|uniref:Transposase n=1 Tax=Klebsiella pneumoniae TaxID=573 RepID=A0A2X1QG81_KLEPN|nr:transposase [Klebsiella pneumoniae]